jgi:hypothetical protein
MAGRGISFLAQAPWARDRVCCVDVDPAKQGKFVPGSGHPILSPAEARRFDPQLVVVCNPNYLEEIRGSLGPRCHFVTLEGQRLGTVDEASRREPPVDDR